MRYWLFKVALGLLLAWITGSDALAQQPPTADSVFQLSATRSPNGELVLSWAIAPGNYLYRDKIMVAKPDGTAIGTGTPPGEMKDDPSFGQTEVYHRLVKAFVPSAVLDSSPALEVFYQGCAEQGICYPPIRKVIDTASLSISDSNATSRPAPAISNSWTSDLAIDSPQSGDGSAEVVPAGQTDLHGSLGSVLLAFVGLGLLLAFTPCIFPMIPILSGMLAQSGELTARRGFALSGVYVLAMALAYAALGVVVAWSGQNLQAVLQTPTALGLMSAVFVALALSMFGFYDLQLPQYWQSRLMGPATRRSGSLGGAAIMGFGSALIVGPCVTPPLAAALLYVAQTGDVLRGALALFALGLGMGLPLLAFGTFGAGILPASGPWLSRVKYVFGFVFIGLAIWMMARVIPQWAVLLLTGSVCAAAGGLLAGSQVKKRPSGSTCRPAFAAVGLIVLGSGIFLMAASVNGSSDHLLRLVGISTPASAATASFETVSTSEELDRALARARQQGKTVMLDFSAEWCVECKVMDRTVFSDPEVLKHLQDFALIRADATDYNEDTRSLMKRFDVVGPPTIIFLGPDRDIEVPDTRFIGAVDAKTFTSRLKQLRSI
jgi:thiol:disulfide interchange protein DsbD